MLTRSRRPERSAPDVGSVALQEASGVPTTSSHWPATLDGATMFTVTSRVEKLKFRKLRVQKPEPSVLLCSGGQHESRRAARRHHRRPSSCHAPAIPIPCTSLSPEELPCSSFHSLLPRAQAELSRPIAAPAISGCRSSIPPTSIYLASSSTHPRAHLSCSPTEIDSPRPPPLETLPHTSSSILRPFSARLELGVSITASPRPLQPFLLPFRTSRACHGKDRLKPEPPVLETGTSGFGLTSA